MEIHKFQSRAHLHRQGGKPRSYRKHSPTQVPGEMKQRSYLQTCQELSCHNQTNSLSKANHLPTVLRKSGNINSCNYTPLHLGGEKEREIFQEPYLQT